MPQFLSLLNLLVSLSSHSPINQLHLPPPPPLCFWMPPPLPIWAPGCRRIQYDIKENFLRRPVFPLLFCQSDVPPNMGGGIARGGWDEGGAYVNSRRKNDW